MDTEKIEYHDKWVIPSVVVLLSIIFVALGYLEHDGDYSISIDAFAVNFLYTLFTALLMRGLVHFLDNLYPWQRSTYIRFGLQMAITLIVYLIIQSFIIFFLNTDNLNGPNKLETIFAVFFVGIVTVISINSLYLLLYLRHQKIKEESKNQNFIIGRLGSKRVSILRTDIRIIIIENTLVKAFDQFDRMLLLQESLSDLEQELDKALFFRANRQSIITREAIKEISYNDNKSCTLKLFHVEHDIIVSRHKAPSFKKWLKNN